MTDFAVKNLSEVTTDCHETPYQLRRQFLLIQTGFNCREHEHHIFIFPHASQTPFTKPPFSCDPLLPFLPFLLLLYTLVPSPPSSLLPLPPSPPCPLSFSPYTPLESFLPSRCTWDACQSSRHSFLDVKVRGKEEDEGLGCCRESPRVGKKERRGGEGSASV